jgi:hypothetical protein
MRNIVDQIEEEKTPSEARRTRGEGRQHVAGGAGSSIVGDESVGKASFSAKLREKRSECLTGNFTGNVHVRTMNRFLRSVCVGHSWVKSRRSEM